MNRNPKQLKYLAVALTIAAISILVGCEADDAAAHEPHAKAQKIILEAGPSFDSSTVKDQWDEKQTSQDEATSGK